MNMRKNAIEKSLWRGINKLKLPPSKQISSHPVHWIREIQYWRRFKRKFMDLVKLEDLEIKELNKEVSALLQKLDEIISHQITNYLIFQNK